MPPQPTSHTDTLLARARQLQLAAERGSAVPPLEGMHIGLVCDNAADPEAQRFQAAVATLGARVAHIDPQLHDCQGEPEAARTARLLGRMYDALAVIAGPPGLLAALRREAGVPVVDGVPPPAPRPPGLEDHDPPPHYLLQAWLVETLS